MSTRRYLPVFTTLCLAFVGLLSLGVGSALAAAPETPETKPATAVTSTSATLNGVLDPGGLGSAGFYFYYSVGAPCTEPQFATAADLTEKAGKEPISEPVTGLTPNSAYVFCAIATHEEGGAFIEQAVGGEQAFTTLGAVPTAEALTATPVTPFSEVLEAKVNAENEATECRFEYGTTLTVAPAPMEHSETCAQGTLERFEVQPASVQLTGLLAGQKYFYRVVAKNGTGAVEPEGEFTTDTAQVPSVLSEAISGLSSTDVTFEGRLNPNYQETKYHFEYATNRQFHDATAIPGKTVLPAVLEELATESLTAGGTLTPDTTYFYRVVAENKAGSNPGPTQQFTTFAVPVPTGGAAENVTRHSAQLSGAVTSQGARTSYSFVYIDEAGYQAALAAHAADPYADGVGTPGGNLEAGFTAVPVGPLSATGLQSGTTYHYALEASNSVGSVTGPDRVFTTPPALPPEAVTGGAAGITQGTATITGTVDPHGLATTIRFEFGAVPFSGAFQTASPATASTGPVPVAFAFNGYLTPGTTYYYRVVASSEEGTSYGAEQSFTTAQPPSAALSPVTQLLSGATVEEVKTVPAKPGPPARKCKKGTTLRHGRCVQATPRKSGKQKGKKTAKRGHKSSHSSEKRGN
jgi:hypothetical protein